MKLSYREKGKGYPLIIMHGLWGASDNWLSIAHHLSDSFHVILPDLRNHGQSPHSPEMNYNVMCEDIIRLIDELHLPYTPHIIGHSMGGKVAMTLLMKHPSYTAKTIVIDIAPVRYQPSKEHIYLSDFIYHTDLSIYSQKTEINRLIESKFPDYFDQQLLLKNIKKGNDHFEWKIATHAIHDHLEDICDWPEQTKRYTSYKPILFIKGEKSTYMNSLSDIKEQFPNAEFVVIPSAGHCIHADRPEILIETIRHFLI